MAENENILETMPGYEMRHFCLWLAKATEAYFQREDVKERFEKWQKEQRQAELLRKESGASE